MTNFAHHQFSTRDLRVNATLTLIVMVRLAVGVSALADVQTLTLDEFMSGC
jgi:hypothetical protein